MRPWDTGATVTAFGDEIHRDLDVQLDVLEAVGIGTLDVRGVDGKNVSALTDDELDRLAAALDERDIEVGAVGSPIGKVDVRGGAAQTAARSAVGDDEVGFEEHLETAERVLEIAARLDADHVRVFSYYLPDGDDPADHRAEVLRRTERTVELAAEYDVPLHHENLVGTYGETPGRVRDLLTAVDSPYFRAIYEPANFYGAGVDPFPDALLQLVEYVDCVHVKDARGAGDWKEDDDVAIAVVGEGDLDWTGILDAFRDRGYDGTFSLEPHLSIADDAGDAPGLSGPEEFERAAEAFQRAFREAETR